MWDFSFGGALSLMWRTMPFILLRMVIYFGITLGYILVTGIGAGVGWGIGGFGDADFRATTTAWGGFAGLGIFGVAMYWAREYILYIVKAGHVAVLVELIDGKSLPEGRGQISHASAVVKERFPQASLLFAMDQLVKGVIRAITGLVRGLLTLLPFPGAQQLSSILSAFLRVAVGFIDEVILAHAIRQRSENAWQSAREALVLYGQNYKPMLKNAAWLALFVYGLSFLVFVLMLAPAALVAYLIPGAWAAGGVIFAVLFAWSVKSALLEPLAITCMMQVYFKFIEGQQPNPEWDAKLEQMSGKFRKLKDRALGAEPRQSAVPGGAEPS
ncbi:hypothetical protein [Roseovarius pacificus]|uniref:hypothetical protein n=1 Tax=Roseovarius pacificus TaxID=337701 RepID=UPI002A18DE70|nr:hypothetical protein [Roseovarius pacificus]